MNLGVPPPPPASRRVAPLHPVALADVQFNDDHTGGHHVLPATRVPEMTRHAHGEGGAGGGHREQVTEDASAHMGASGQQLGARSGAHAQAGSQGIAQGGTQAAHHCDGSVLPQREARPLRGVAQLRAGQPGAGLGGPRPLNSEIREGPISDGAQTAGGGVHPPRQGFWEHMSTEGGVVHPADRRHDGTTSALRDAFGAPIVLGGGGAQPSVAPPILRHDAGRVPLVRHNNPQQLMYELRERCPFLGPVPDMHEFERTILDAQDVVPANAQSHGRFILLISEVTDNGLGALVVRDSARSRESVTYTPHELSLIKARGEWNDRFNPAQGGFSVWALDCLPTFPEANQCLTADQWNSHRWPEVQAMVELQCTDVCLAAQVKRDRLLREASVPRPMAAAAVGAGAVAGSPQGLPVLPPLLDVRPAAGAVPMDIEPARLERPAPLTENATEAEYTAYGRRVAAYEAQRAAIVAAKAAAKAAKEAADRAYLEAEAAERADAELHVPDEVRPSGASTEVPAHGGRHEVYHSEHINAKETFKPSPPLKYSGNDINIKVAQWLRSMLTYLQLTNTQPNRWALVAETYLTATAQTVWNSHRDELTDAPAWTDLSECLNKHFADRFAAQKLLRQLDTFRVEGPFSTVTAQATMRLVTGALEQHDALPGICKMDLGTKCQHVIAALRRKQPSTLEGDKARAVARKTDTAFRAGTLHGLTAIADYVVNLAPTEDDAIASKGTRGGGGGDGEGGGGGTDGGNRYGEKRGRRDGGDDRRRSRDPEKGRHHGGDGRNGNGKRETTRGGDQGPSKHGGGGSSYRQGDAKGSHQGGGSGGNKRKGDYVTFEVKQARMQHPGLCWKCEQMGHRANECPNGGKAALGDAFKKPPASGR